MIQTAPITASSGRVRYRRVGAGQLINNTALQPFGLIHGDAAVGLTEHRGGSSFPFLIYLLVHVFPFPSLVNALGVFVDAAEGVT